MQSPQHNEHISMTPRVARNAPQNRKKKKQLSRAPRGGVRAIGDIGTLKCVHCVVFASLIRWAWPFLCLRQFCVRVAFFSSIGGCHFVFLSLIFWLCLGGLGAVGPCVFENLFSVRQILCFCEDSWASKKKSNKINDCGVREID